MRKATRLLTLFGTATGISLAGSALDASVVYDMKFGGNDRVTIPNSTSLNPSMITLETRVNFGRIAFGNGYSGTDCQYMIAKGGERYAGMYGLYSGWGNPTTRTTTRLGFSIEDWGGAGHLQRDITPETNRWYHVAGTYDGNVMRLYLDGRLLGSRTVGAYTLGNNRPLYFGYMENTYFPYYLTGLMDEVRIWDYARTGDQIRETMDVALSGNESGLVGLWNFDESIDSQTVFDATGNGHNGYRGYSTSADYRDPWRVAGTPLPTTPEPSSLVLWCTLSGLCLLVRWRSKQKLAKSN